VDLKEIVKEFEKNSQCNCDLDNWEPEQSTGHSHVCRIHKSAIQTFAEIKKLKKSGRHALCLNNFWRMSDV
jgi:hypothetical protein